LEFSGKEKDYTKLAIILILEIHDTLLEEFKYGLDTGRYPGILGTIHSARNDLDTFPCCHSTI
jgi:hypothetical protein